MQLHSCLMLLVAYASFAQGSPNAFTRTLILGQIPTFLENSLLQLPHLVASGCRSTGP